MAKLAVAEFRRIVERELLDQGLEKVKLAGDVVPAFCCTSKEVRRFFAPHAMKRPWGCVLLGVLGVDVPELGRWLIAQGRSPRLARLSYYISNEQQFIDPTPVVTDADLPALRAWMGRIRSSFDGLPSDLDELARLSCQPFGEVSRHLVHNGGFWPAFEEWRGRNSPQAGD